MMSGGSMMEQLVPEIRMIVLSYLDYKSLCSLCMTNPLIRNVADDDNLWKSLYHKDFTVEQDSITPSNGWKAYYAATRAIVNSNQQFFNIIRDRSLADMGRLWLNADYVKCVHPSGELFTGYYGVITSWRRSLIWEPGFNFQVRDLRVRVLTDMAWVTMKVSVGNEHNPLTMTNVFEFHNGRWYMVHHHSSIMFTIGHEANHPPFMGSWWLANSMVERNATLSRTKIANTTNATNSQEEYWFGGWVVKTLWQDLFKVSHQTPPQLLCLFQDGDGR